MVMPFFRLELAWRFSFDVPHEPPTVKNEKNLDAIVLLACPVLNNRAAIRWSRSIYAVLLSRRGGQGQSMYQGY